MAVVGGARAAVRGHVRRRDRGWRARAAPKTLSLASGGLGKPDAAVLPNDPAFDAAHTRRRRMRFRTFAPHIRSWCPSRSECSSPSGVEAPLLPTTRAGARAMAGVLVAGRLPDPRESDEIVVNESLARSAGLRDRVDDDRRASRSRRRLVPRSRRASSPTGDVNFRARLRVVGIAKSIDNETDWVPSSGFFAQVRRPSGRHREHVRRSSGTARPSSRIPSRGRSSGGPSGQRRARLRAARASRRSRASPASSATACCSSRSRSSSEASSSPVRPWCERSPPVPPTSQRGGRWAPIVAWPPARWCCPRR